MPHVLLLFEYPTVNGGERSILTTLDEVRCAGFDVEAVAPPLGPLGDELQRRDVPHRPLQFSQGNRRRPLDEVRHDLCVVIEQAGPDLVHANSLSMARISGPVARQRGTPSIGHLRDIINVSAQATADLNSHTRLLAVSEATREFHVAAGLDASKVFTLYNGIDVAEFAPGEPTGFLHRELKLPLTAMLIGAVGQIGLRKGFDVLLEAVAGLERERQDVHLVIVGQRYSQKEESRRFESRLHELSGRGALRGRVHFLGRREDMAEILRELTLLVHPARQEPLGRVLLEAAACGVPIVATDVGGTREILGTEPIAGALVSVNDTSSISVAIKELLRDADQRNRLRSAARRRIEVQFDHRDAAAALVQHYLTVIEQQP